MVKDIWNDFVEHRDSEEAKKISEANKANSQKNLYPHRIGSRRYVRKLEKWEKMEQNVDSVILNAIGRRDSLQRSSDITRICQGTRRQCNT